MMRFAKIWFSIAGWWGILLLTPLFFTYRLVGLRNPPPVTHPEYYFGFVTVGLAWQVAFLVISAHPARYRWMMVPAIIEKLGYALTCFVLFARHASSSTTAIFGAVDLFLGLGFIVAFRLVTTSSKVGG